MGQETLFLKDTIAETEDPFEKIQLEKNIKIVYLDNHVLVAVKPAGLSTQADTLASNVDKSGLDKPSLDQPSLDKLSLDKLSLNQSNTAANLEFFLKKFLKEKFCKKGQVFLHALHRLDKPVSGLVLFARTSKALTRLNAQIKENALKKERNSDFQKKYLALVEGRVLKEKGFLENFLIHASHKAKIVSQECSGAKKALLYFKVLEKRENQTLLEIELLTGRYHQIRSQLAHAGHPIVGDSKYGSKLNLPSLRLHAYQLTFVHPVTKSKLSFLEKAFF